MDSERGKELFKFDRSLMERLSDNDLPMTQINVQRRMRPEISHFVRYAVVRFESSVSNVRHRTILYENLEDHRLVKEYPRVQGMQSNVFFLNHTNSENGSEDSASKFNMYEVCNNDFPNGFIHRLYA